MYVQLQPIHEVKGYFWIYLMYLAMFGTRDFCSKLVLLQFVENCSMFSKTIFLVSFKGYYIMSKNLAGFLLRQESILGPLLFLIYINNLPDRVNSAAKLFADDTSHFSIFQKNKIDQSFRRLSF